MRGFEAELKAVAAELDLPEPVRSRTLLELRSDLEAMAAALRAEGIEEEEARTRALDVLLPSAEVGLELRGVHRPLYQRLADRFSEPGRRRAERLLLGLLALVALGSGLGALRGLDLVALRSPWLWVVLTVAVLVVTAGGSKLFQLFAMAPHGRARLRRGLPLLVALGVAALVVGFGGVVADLYGAAGRLGAAGGVQSPEVLAWLRRSSALMCAALLTAASAGLFWLLAAVRIAGIERLQAAALGFSQEEGGVQ